jgi:hypothetical protein
MARGNSGRGTSIGPMALLAGDRKARLAPNSTEMAKIGHSWCEPIRARVSSTAALTASRARVAATISLRVRRSAVSPAIRVSRNSGRNCARPIMLTMNADSPTEWVRRAIA